MAKQIKLGNKVKDVVTGFEGIVTGRAEYLGGCVQYCVTPVKNNKDNKYPEGQYIDEGQLRVISKGVAVTKKKSDPGGVMANTPPAAYRG